MLKDLEVMGDWIDVTALKRARGTKQEYSCVAAGRSGLDPQEWLRVVGCHTQQQFPWCWFQRFGAGRYAHSAGGSAAIVRMVA